MKNTLHIYISIQDCEATSRRIKDKGERERERILDNMGPFPERERERLVSNMGLFPRKKNKNK